MSDAEGADIVVELARWDGEDFAVIQMVCSTARTAGQPAARLPGGDMNLMEVRSGESGEWLPVPVGWFVALHASGRVTIKDPVAEHLASITVTVNDPVTESRVAMVECYCGVAYSAGDGSDEERAAARAAHIREVQGGS